MDIQKVLSKKRQVPDPKLSSTRPTPLPPIATLSASTSAPRTLEGTTVPDPKSSSDSTRDPYRSTEQRNNRNKPSKRVSFNDFMDTDYDPPLIWSSPRHSSPLLAPHRLKHELVANELDYVDSKQWDHFDSKPFHVLRKSRKVKLEDDTATTTPPGPMAATQTENARGPATHTSANARTLVFPLPPRPHRSRRNRSRGLRLPYTKLTVYQSIPFHRTRRMPTPLPVPSTAATPPTQSDSVPEWQGLQPEITQDMQRLVSRFDRIAKTQQSLIVRMNSAIEILYDRLSLKTLNAYSEPWDHCQPELSGRQTFPRFSVRHLRVADEYNGLALKKQQEWQEAQTKDMRIKPEQLSPRKESRGLPRNESADMEDDQKEKGRNRTKGNAIEKTMAKDISEREKKKIATEETVKREKETVKREKETKSERAARAELAATKDRVFKVEKGTNTEKGTKTSR
ncbi:hypothetical protein BG011_005159 [Mortierella polycephala]|uniref:Uncharacterized protein n=1 Tax=Mortierella polycephala TaxID=41804 RepID=A0A9P6U1B5_9FUNG|nr:hypothetical protein BG011_005159 [Mortierella polycephala]